MHLFATFCMFICALLLIYTLIYAYIGAFWLAFGLVLYQFQAILVNPAAQSQYYPQRDCALTL